MLENIIGECVRGRQCSDVTYTASVCERGEPITPTIAARSRDHIDQSGSEFGAVPRATANMAALGAGEHSAGEETLLTSLVDTPVLLVIVDLVVVVIRLLSIFGDSSSGKKDRVECTRTLSLGDDDCESNE